MKKSKSLLVSVLVLPMIVGCGQQHSHSYDMNNLKWEWASDYSSCTVTAPCTGCDETKDLGSATVNTVNTAPTCENNGSDVHTASIIVEGTTYSDVKTIAVNKLGHSIDSTKWLSDETNHWHKCEREGCTHTEAVANHEFGPWSGIEGTEKHTRACTICGKTQLGDHSWDDGVISKEPTHMTTGTKTYTCSDCGDTKQMTISKTLEHTFNLEVKEAKYLKNEKACNAYAVYYKSCECGESSHGTEWEATFEDVEGGYGVHVYDREVVDAEYLKSLATCKDHDIYYKSCQCGESSHGKEGEATFADLNSPLSTHNYVSHARVEATKTVEGNAAYYTCEHCDLVFDEDKNIIEAVPTIRWLHYVGRPVNMDEKGISDFYQRVGGNEYTIENPGEPVTEATLASEEIAAIIAADDSRVIDCYQDKENAIVSTYATQEEIASSPWTIDEPGTASKIILSSKYNTPEYSGTNDWSAACLYMRSSKWDHYSMSASYEFPSDARGAANTLSFDYILGNINNDAHELKVYLTDKTGTEFLAYTLSLDDSQFINFKTVVVDIPTRSYSSVRIENRASGTGGGYADTVIKNAMLYYAPGADNGDFIGVYSNTYLMNVTSGAGTMYADVVGSTRVIWGTRYSSGYNTFGYNRGSSLEADRTGKTDRCFAGSMHYLVEDVTEYSAFSFYVFVNMDIKIASSFNKHFGSTYTEFKRGWNEISITDATMISNIKELVEKDSRLDTYFPITSTPIGFKFAYSPLMGFRA